MRGIIIGIKEWLVGGTCWQKENSTTQQVIGKSEQKKDPEITFESDQELLERKRGVNIGDDFIGYIIKSDGVWGWLQVKEASSYKIEILNTEVLIAITEKLKELNGCSDVRVEIAKLEQKVKEVTPTTPIDEEVKQNG